MGLQRVSLSGRFSPHLFAYFSSRTNSQDHKISSDTLTNTKGTSYRKVWRNTIVSAIYIISILCFHSDLLGFSLSTFQDSYHDFTSRSYKISQLIFLCWNWCPMPHSTGTSHTLCLNSLRS